MPVLSLASARSLANSATRRVIPNLAFTAANISSSATQGQLGGVVTRPGSVAVDWTIANGNISISSTGIPYHSYSNSAGGTTATAQSHLETWEYRGGNNFAALEPKVAVGTSLAGFFLNGIPIYGPSSGSLVPTGNTQAIGYNYNAASESATDLNYNFFHDNAGGFTFSSGTYHYRDYSFASAWITGEGKAGSPSAGATGLSEVSLIPYLNVGLFSPDGHSRILGISADGYPIYGPYGYSDPLDPSAGVRRMLSGYTLRRRDTRGEAVVDLSTYPMGIFVQDYAYTGTNAEIINISVSNAASSYAMSRNQETKNTITSTSIGNNPSFVISAGSVISFNLSTVGQPFWIKTQNTTGTQSGVSTGEIVNNGNVAGTVYWHTAGVTPGTYYYISQNNSNFGGTITVTSSTPSDLDTSNGRYCYTPEYPSGTYAYFMTVDENNGAAYPYIIGNTYYGSPASL